MAVSLHKKVPIPATQEEAKKFAEEYHKTRPAHHLLCLGIADDSKPYGLRILNVNDHGESNIFAAYLCSLLRLTWGTKAEGVIVFPLGPQHRVFMDNVLRRFRIYAKIPGPHHNLDALRAMVNHVRRKDGGNGVIVLRFDATPPDLVKAHPYVRAAEEALLEKQQKNKAA